MTDTPSSRDPHASGRPGGAGDGAAGTTGWEPAAGEPAEPEQAPAAEADVLRPAAPDGARMRWGRFVAAALVAAAVLVGAVAAFNLLTDPWGVFGIGIFPPRVNQDRSTKADLLTELEQPPELLIYGSSRAWTVEAARVEQATGLRTFNAAVTAGRPADAYVFTRGRPRHLAARDPGLPLAARRGGVPARPAAAVAAGGVAVQPLPALAGPGGGPARRAGLAGLVDRSAGVLRGVEEAPDAGEGAGELAQADLARRHRQDAAVERGQGGSQGAREVERGRGGPVPLVRAPRRGGGDLRARRRWSSSPPGAAPASWCSRRRSRRCSRRRRRRGGEAPRRGAAPARAAPAGVRLRGRRHDQRLVVRRRPHRASSTPRT